MSRMILPLNGLFQPEVIKHFIKQEEPWHLIAYEPILLLAHRIMSMNGL